MKKLFFAAAALVALSLASCTKDQQSGTNGVVNGEKAGLTLSFILPNDGTRATDEGPIVGTIAESNVSTADVFIFESNGVQAAVGGHTRFDDMTLFTATTVSGNNVYSLNAGEEIETLSGMKTIYVGANVPAGTFTGTETEAQMLAKIAAVNTMHGDNNFTMFSELEQKNLLADDPDTTSDDSQNLVQMNVTRVVSKLVASKATIAAKTWSVAPLTLTYTVQNFRVFNHSLSSYVPANFITAGVAKTYNGASADYTSNFNVFTTDASATAANIVDESTLTDDLGITAMTGYYIGENYPMDASGQPMALNQNTTYIMVATTVTASHAANVLAINDTDNDGTVEAGEGTIDTDGDGTAERYEGAIVWEPITGLYGGVATPSSIYLIKDAKGNAYITDTEAKADVVARAVGVPTTADAVEPSNGVGIWEYEQGYVHFNVYLNHEALNDYAVLRNQFIHVKINDILSNNLFFPGYPGLPGTPSQPTPPTDPTQPDPLTPTDPVDDQPALLDVEVQVMPWTYKENVTILQ